MFLKYVSEIFTNFPAIADRLILCIVPLILLFPEDPMKTQMSCWFIEKNALALVDAFLNEKRDEDMFFLMFAHGYEPDFNTRHSNWAKFEAVCKKVSGRKDVICCSVRDAFRMHREESGT